MSTMATFINDIHHIRSIARYIVPICSAKYVFFVLSDFTPLSQRRAKSAIYLALTFIILPRLSYLKL